MVEIELKPDKKRPGWFAASEVEPNTGHFHWRVSANSLAWRPPTDVYITEEAIVVRVEIAGMRASEFSISLDNHLLAISGSRPDQPEQRAYHQMEIRFGEFRTDVELHWPVDTEKIDAEYRDGFLRVILPKTHPRSIEIQE
jgi:HSP20 family protein